MLRCCGICIRCCSSVAVVSLSGLAGGLAQVRALCGAQLAAVAAEAESRGVIDASQSAGTSGWVAEHAWHSRREAATVAKTARLLRRPDMRSAAEAVLTADVDVGTAAVVAAEYDKLAPDLVEDARPVALEHFLTVGADHGPAGVRRLRQELLARYGEHHEFEDHQEKCRRLIDLSPGAETSAGVGDYRLTTDNEGRAVLEAAIGPLSAPASRPHHPRARPPAGRAAPRRGPHRRPPPIRRRRAAPADLTEGRADPHHGLPPTSRTDRDHLAASLRPASPGTNAQLLPPHPPIARPYRLTEFPPTTGRPACRPARQPTRRGPG